MKIDIDKKGKATVEIHDFDLWDMDKTLAIIIHPMLIKLKAEQHGFNKIEDEDVPENLQVHTDKHPTYGYSKEKWDWALDEMIFAFGSKLRPWEDDFETGVFDMDFKTWEDEKGRYAGFKANPHHTQVIDYEGTKNCRKRIQNGFKLFGVYYQALWD